MKFFVFRVIIGHKENSTRGSNARRFLTRLSILLILMLLFLTASRHVQNETSSFDEIIAYFSIIHSSAYFFFVVLVIPFLTSKKFIPNVTRLFRDVATSIVLTIFSFAQMYAVSGIVPPDGEHVAKWDYVYFSAVTFSTLGYGDFRPTSDSRLWSALEAVIGNLHLGIIVAVAFLATQPLLNKNGDHTNERHKQ